jgi:hypothetical protein
MTMTTDTRPDVLEHAIGADGVLVLRLNDGDVRLRGVDGDVVHVRSLDGRSLDRLDIERGPASLAINARAADALEEVAHAASGAADLLVELPAEATVVVEATSADLHAENLTGEQRLMTASGDVVVRSVRGKLTVEAVSGDIEITASGPLEAFARTVSGDLSLRVQVLRGLRATTTSGDIAIAAAFEGDGAFRIETVSGDTTLEPIGDVQVEATTLTGDIRDADVDHRSPRGRGRRPITVGTGAGPTIAFRSTSGDLAIRPDQAALPVPSGQIERSDPAADRAGTLEILRALERGEIDVAEAGRRLSGARDAVTEASDPATEATDLVTEATGEIELDGDRTDA